MLRNLALSLVLTALLPAPSANSDTLSRPTPREMKDLPEFPRQSITLRRITAVNGKTRDMRFALRQEFEIVGIALTDSGIESLQGWIIGAKRGGSNLEFRRVGKDRIVVRPVDIPAAKTTWPASSEPPALQPRQDIRLIIRDDNRPGQDLVFTLKGSFYHCGKREQVCGEQ